MPRLPARRLALAAATAAIALTLGGCATGGTAGSASAEGDALSGDLTIFAAASLAVAFDDLAVEFEALHSEVDIRPISYDGSSVLATQLIEGAPADVFASADERTMTAVVDAGAASDPALFASNTLVVITPADNPAGISELADLADPDATVVLCADEVPCGAASQTLLGYGDVHVVADSLEQNVTAVLTKVASGEADAGIVYATDARGRDDVASFVPQGAESVVNHYPIAATDAARNPAVATAFVDFVLSDAGQSVLATAGFGAP